MHCFRVPVNKELRKLVTGAQQHKAAVPTGQSWLGLLLWSLVAVPPIWINVKKKENRIIRWPVSNIHSTQMSSSQQCFTHILLALHFISPSELYWPSFSTFRHLSSLFLPKPCATAKQTHPAQLKAPTANKNSSRWQISKGYSISDCSTGPSSAFSRKVLWGNTE